MDGVGTFSKKVEFIGMLRGTEIHNGARFIRYAGDDKRYVAYLGNRVNLYIIDRIGDLTGSRVTPGLSIGINVMWSFSALIDQDSDFATQQCFFREVNWGPRGQPTYATDIVDPNIGFIESKVEYAAPTTPGVGFQIGETDPNVYTFPIDADNPAMYPYVAGPTSGPPPEDAMLTNSPRRYVVPLVARGDFMTVYFWCDPRTWTGLDVGIPSFWDRVEVYAVSGSDVAGSQRIGGGHG
jgi:hypothetical protein